MFGVLALLISLLHFSSASPLVGRSAFSAESFEALCASPTCAVSSLTVPLPSNQTALTVPPGQKVTAVSVGRGVQNYTCTAGSWVTAGALANLYDASCLVEVAQALLPNQNVYSLLPQIAFEVLNYPDSYNIPVKYHHQFITTPGSTTAGAISPEFISVANATNKVVANKNGTLNDPSDPNVNVAWLELTAIAGQGSLAKTVFRTNTVNGQPPTSCSTAGTTLSVEYAAMYFFLS